MREPHDAVIVIVNLDPQAPHEGEVELPSASLGLASDVAFDMEEVRSGAVYDVAARASASDSIQKPNPC